TRPRDRDDARAVAPFDCRTDDVSEILSPLALRPSGAMRFIGRWTILVVLVLQIEEDVRSSQESNGCGFQGLLVTGSAQTLRASSILHDVYREAQIDDEMLCGGAVDERFQLRHLQRTQRAVAIHQRFGSELPVREHAQTGDAFRSEVVEIRVEDGRRRQIVREDRKSTRLNSSHDQISYA